MENYNPCTKYEQYNDVTKIGGMISNLFKLTNVIYSDDMIKH